MHFQDGMIHLFFFQKELKSEVKVLNSLLPVTTDKKFFCDNFEILHMSTNFKYFDYYLETR